MNFNEISAYHKPEESPGFLLWKTSIFWRRAIEKTLKVFNLTHPQFVTLATTAWLTKEGKKVTQAEIGRLAGLDPNTTSQILRGLQTKGLIKRVKDERSKYPILTKYGTEILAKALPAVECKDAEFFAPLDLNESGIITALQTLMENQ